ncbi:DUF3149 domain-containing protein [Chitinimonas sp.]|uniref:DUF3149 domain-containing protein n=1 Tax=Chitinimonas sp. TaxID=1934313 RepID=UPI0035B0FC98
MNIAVQDLFTTDIGLLSLVTIGVVIGIASYMVVFVRRHIAEDEAAQRQQQDKLAR